MLSMNMNMAANNGYISYEVPQTKPRYPDLKDQSADLKTYIRENALKYVGPEPKLTEASYGIWYEKLIKIEKIVYEKYMKKLIQQNQPQQIPQLCVQSHSAQPIQPMDTHSLQRNTSMPLPNNGQLAQVPSMSPPQMQGFNSNSSSDTISGQPNIDNYNALQCQYSLLQQKYNKLMTTQKSMYAIQEKFAELEKYTKILCQQRSKDEIINHLQAQILQLTNLNVTVAAQNEEYEQEKLLLQSEQIIHTEKYNHVKQQYIELKQQQTMQDQRMKALEEENQRLKMQLMGGFEEEPTYDDCQMDMTGFIEVQYH